MREPHPLQRIGHSRIFQHIVWIAIVVVFHSATEAVSLTPDDSGCIKWRDSLVTAGVRSLSIHDIPGAQRYFTAAYRCGMNKDSMCYFAAEMFIQRFVLDTALVFNSALEKSTTFDRELQIAQRVRIYRLLGRERTADSLLAKGRGYNRHEFTIRAGGSRKSTTIGSITFIPQNFTIHPDEDYDDAGTGAFQ